MLLRDALPTPSDGMRLATIATVSQDGSGSLGVDIGGGRIVDPCPRLDLGWTPAVGMTVLVGRVAESWVAMGPIASSNPAAVSVAVSLAFPFNVLPVAPTVSSPLVVTATSTGSWRPRGPGGWMQTDVYQGGYSTAWGFYSGLYFYGGGAFATVTGTTCTSLSINISRKGLGGIGGAEYVHLAPHTHTSQPGGAPYFPGPSTTILGPAWSSSQTISLPVAWGQGLIDGTYAGIGHRYSGTGDYAIYNSVGADSNSGRLTLGFA